MSPDFTSETNSEEKRQTSTQLWKDVPLPFLSDYICYQKGWNGAAISITYNVSCWFFEVSSHFRK